MRLIETWVGTNQTKIPYRNINQKEKEHEVLSKGHDAILKKVATFSKIVANNCLEVGIAAHKLL